MYDVSSRAFKEKRRVKIEQHDMKGDRLKWGGGGGGSGANNEDN